ncbi:MAG: hypothetical protein EOP18_12975, partial [Rhizobiaceae bacterium]
LTSSPRRRGPSNPRHQRSSRDRAAYWIPAFAGMTVTIRGSLRYSSSRRIPNCSWCCGICRAGSRSRPSFPSD